MAYFPMFVDLEGQSCLVVGGGMVAFRKIRLLLDFDARVEVVALACCEPLTALLHENPAVHLCRRAFCDSDLQGKALVIAATNDPACNHEISVLCQKQRIPVNVVDTKEDCSFIVPSYVKEKQVVAAFSSGGNAPILTQYLKEKAYEYLTPLLGEINELLGECRKTVQQNYKTEEEKKEVYLRILVFALEKGRVPTGEELPGFL